MQHLPVELLQYIFMLLSPCSDLPAVIQVCKYWRTIGLEVLKLRKNAITSAYRLEAPLRWQSPQCSIPAPTKRFGATVLHHDKYVYVFGGATSMLTTFNDLWRFELSTRTWKRLVVEGELPTPRAHAKGGFIGDKLFLFGGCHSFRLPGMHHTSRMEWLSDLSSFNIHSLCWTKHSLRHVNSFIIEQPVPVTAGQTGCFLPAGEIGHPSVLILFGGISQSMTDCVNTVCVINPERSEWMSISAPSRGTSHQVPWPAGRCGHSVCALDSTRMLVLFGNLQSPIVQSHSSESPPTRRPRLPDEGDEVNGGSVEADASYHGHPAGDIWILTRVRAESSIVDWFNVQWYWTKVNCLPSPSGCPPLDFYHACTVCLPWSTSSVCDQFFTTGIDDNTITNYESQPMSTTVTSMSDTFTVVCISQPTRILLDEATKQRRFWWHRAQSVSDSRSKSIPRSTSLSTSVIEVSDSIANPDNTQESVVGFSSSRNLLSPSGKHILLSRENQTSPTNGNPVVSSLPPSPKSTSFGGNRRSAERRARQLEALAIQERRLFGSRGPPSHTINGSPPFSSSPKAQSPSALSRSDLLSDILQSVPLRPLATYTLCLCIPTSNCDPSSHKDGSSYDQTNHSAIARWLTPKKPHFLDLVFGPPECLGFSCAFGHGCLFLFGGLSDSDEVGVDRQRDPNSDAALPDDPAQIISVDQNPSRTGDLGPVRLNTARISQFYVLQARSLVGTLI